MKRLLSVLILAIIVSGCKDVSKTSEEKIVQKEVLEKVDSEWTILFDGSNFNNWKGYLKEDMHSEWTIEDGAMLFTPGEQGGKNIITKDKYTDFVLSIEWKISEGGNSGIFWSVYEDENFPEAYQTGPEIQVLDNLKHPDSFVAEGTHKAGSLYDMIACPNEVINPAGEWNLCVLEINHKTNIGKVTMNGTEVMTFPVHGETWNEMVANSKFKNWEGFGKYQTGHIGLQDHGDKVWYRNIKIKEL
ncbi:DUF1080 domain-containing protein [Flavobacteriaceae bacterium S0862]|nr:DUF1080 domain-containing protein [Flavobacteriaceae bacterium S0862]